MEGIQVWEKQHSLSLEKCPEKIRQPLEEHCETHHYTLGTPQAEPGLCQLSWYRKILASWGCLEENFGCCLTDPAACSPEGFGDQVNRHQRNIISIPRTSLWNDVFSAKQGVRVSPNPAVIQVPITYSETCCNRFKYPTDHTELCNDNLPSTPFQGPQTQTGIVSLLVSITKLS